MHKIFLILLLFLHTSLLANEGETLFKTYCWGCHHQTSMAFGPSFEQIANTRNSGEIIAQIVDPTNTAITLGYERSAMPAFNRLTSEQLQALTSYIQSFKD